jgi:ankyrin repeat protein
VRLGRELALFEAVSRGDVSAVQQLLSVDAVDANARHASHGGTPLHIAAGLVAGGEEVQSSLIRVLVQKGHADVNSRADNGATPLHW